VCFHSWLYSKAQKVFTIEKLIRVCKLPACVETLLVANLASTILNIRDDKN